VEGFSALKNSIFRACYFMGEAFLKPWMWMSSSIVLQIPAARKLLDIDSGSVLANAVSRS
jgi:hypothetical protein